MIQIPVRRPLTSNRLNAMRLPSGETTGESSKMPRETVVRRRIEPPLAVHRRDVLRGRVIAAGPRRQPRRRGPSDRPTASRLGRVAQPAVRWVTSTRPVPSGSIVSMFVEMLPVGPEPRLNAILPCAGSKAPASEDEGAEDSAAVGIGLARRDSRLRSASRAAMEPTARVLSSSPRAQPATTIASSDPIAARQHAFARPSRRHPPSRGLREVVRGGRRVPDQDRMGAIRPQSRRGPRRRHRRGTG